MQSLEFYHNLYNELVSLKGLTNLDLLKKSSELGRQLKLSGFQQESDYCFNILLGLLQKVIKEGKVHLALVIEGLIYGSFVKTTETEDHYFKCFNMWSGALQDLGRKHTRDLHGGRDPRKICFVMQNAVLLGHTEVMLTIVDAWRKMGLEADIYLAGLGGLDPPFKTILDARKITYIPLAGPNNAPLPLDQSVALLQDRLEQLNIQTAVWLSIATIASFALAARLAPRQVFWSVKFHPVFLPEVDVHLCGGHEAETERVYHGKTWTVSPFPLTLSHKENSPSDVQNIRAAFPKDAILLGSLAREEKLNSPGFLMAVGGLLARNPQAHFLWTGRSQPEVVLTTFKNFGVADRCHFIGWVDSNLYAEVLDIFLETFPFGCGITGFQAMSHGTPFLSMEGMDTLYGYQLHGGVMQRTHGRPMTRADYEALEILTAADQAHYMELAQKLIDDPAYRKAIGAREKAYVQSERDAVPRYAQRMWTNITTLSE
ncbi:MAG: hypothetical protein K2P94_10950 [Rhodospirillaceae bacterium]|nr:hypothetical protein [Rhodospirillaceae bacterium]